MKIIGHGVDDDSPAGDFFYCESGCDDGTPCDPLIYEHGWKISGMFWVFAVMRIVVAFGVCKRIVAVSTAGPALMNMQTKYRVLAVPVFGWDTIKGSCNKDGRANVIKTDFAI